CHEQVWSAHRREILHGRTARTRQRPHQGACWASSRGPWRHPTIGLRRCNLPPLSVPATYGTPCAVALIDRLTHHAEIISIDGQSYRKREAEQAQKPKR